MPKIVRRRIYLQTYNFKIKHIAGTKNLVADWLSRLYEEEVSPLDLNLISTLDKDDVYEMGQNLRLGLYAIELRPRGDKSKPVQKTPTEFKVSKGKRTKKTLESNMTGDKLRKEDDKVDSPIKAAVAREKPVMRQVEPVVEIWI